MQKRASTYIQWLQHLFVRHSFRETPSSSRNSPVVSFESNRLLSGEDCGAGVDLQLGCSATATAGLETAPSRVHSTQTLALVGVLFPEHIDVYAGSVYKAVSNSWKSGYSFNSSTKRIRSLFCEARVLIWKTEPQNHYPQGKWGS